MSMIVLFALPLKILIIYYAYFGVYLDAWDFSS